MEQKHRRAGGLIWPVMLVSAGVVFLLNNLGILSWGIWDTLFRLWPVLLVAFGLDILFGRRSTVGAALAALLLVVVLAGAIILNVSGTVVGTASMVNRTEHVDEDLKGAREARVEISFGAGNLVLGALPEGSDKLLAGSIDLVRNERMQLSHTGNAQAAQLSLRSAGEWRTGIGAFDESEGRVWDLQLNRDIPLSLELNSSVGKATLDLDAVRLTHLSVDGSVGQVNLRLPRRGQYDVRIDGGLGELIILVPADLEARLRIDGGLGSVDVQGEFEQRNSEYITPGFASADNRADVRINGGLGRVEVRRLSE